MTWKSIRYKLVILGHLSVGKSSLITRFVEGKFTDNVEATVGVSFLTQNVLLDKYTIIFDIWDTAGQERYNSLVPMYYKGSDAAIVVFDITSEQSFSKAEYWITELQTQTKTKQMLIVLAGNKVDMEDERRVSIAHAKRLADDNGILYFETSAKNNVNVTEMFQEIARILPKDDRERSKPKSFIDLADLESKSRGHSTCC